MIPDDFVSGDQALQLVPASNWTNGGFSPWANYNITNARWIGCRGISLQAQAISVGLSITNSSQATAWNCGTTTSPVGNTLNMPGPLPSGLTVTQLNQSASPWGNSVTYTAGQQACNGGNLYRIVTSGTSDPNSSGPSGTGSNIADGTCVWAYISAGSPIYCYAQRKCMVPGTLVTGISGTGPYTITLQPPNGSANAIQTAISSSNTLQFLNGIPLGVMTNNVLQSSYESCHLISLYGEAVNINNADSMGEIDVAVKNCTMDVTFANGQSGSQAAVYVFGGSYGGCRVKFEGNTVVGPLKQSVNTSGNIWALDMVGNHFQPPRSNTAQPNVWLEGVQSGNVERNTIWGAIGASALRVGGPDGADQLSQPLYNSCYNLNVRNNTVTGIYDGFAGITVSFGSRRNFTGNVFRQITALGAGNASGYNVINTPTNDIYDWNDFTQIDAAPYTLATGLTATYGLYDRFNPTPFQTFTTPSPSAVPTFTLGTWTPSISAVTQGDLALSNVTSSGEYRVIGDMVFIAFVITATVTYTTASGIMHITGLPIPCGNHGFNYSIDPSLPGGAMILAGSGTSYGFEVQSGSSFICMISFKSSAAAGTQGITNNPSGTTYSLSGSGWYRM